MDINDDTKICLNCKHYFMSKFLGLVETGEHKCKAPAIMKSNVTGKNVFESCYFIRNRDYLCGWNGKWFEPRSEQKDGN